MIHKGKGSQSEPAAPKAGEATGKETAFDLWLNRGLHQLFDDIANEPIPEDLLKLIQESKET